MDRPTVSWQSTIQQMREQREVLVKRLRAANPVAPNVLSEVAERLALLNDMLSEWLSPLKEDQINAEKIAFKAHRAAGVAVTEAKELTRYDTVKERSAYDTVEEKVRSTWKHLDMVRTHISAEKEERK